MKLARVAFCLLPLSAIACGGSDETSSDQASSSAATSTVSAAGAGGSGSGGAGGGSSTCAYPAGPFGLSKGLILDGGLEYAVLAPGIAFGTSLGMSDLYDCDGSKGINAILIKVSAAWCGPCFKMSQEIDHLYETTWQGKGITVEELLVENVSGGPADLGDAINWRTQTGEATLAYTGIDPGDTFSTSFFPFATLVDPRTMQIVEQDTEASFVQLSDVEQLATKNM